ncbi:MULTISPECIES: hypothetical protein [Aphanizomenonaceae]|nr:MULTISPECIES: hypothetical protein [Aphanizomenonaceae]
MRLIILGNAIAQNPLFCDSLTVINCDLMGKRSLKIHYLVLPELR